MSLRPYLMNSQLPISYRQLVVLPVGIYGAFQLAAQGGCVQQSLDLKARRERLHRFQEEFRAFADFIRGKHQTPITRAVVPKTT